MKKALAILLVYSILMTLLVVSPFTANADEKSVAETGATSGTTGECTWKIEDGVLTISGNGKMGSYSRSPWRDYNITEAVIEKGVTSIGESAFYDCYNLRSVTIPDSVTSIGEYAFSGCSGLTSVIVPDSVTSIGDYAFDGCTGLTSIDIPDSVTSIGEWAFSDTAWYNNQPDGLIYAGKVAYKMKGSCPSEVVIKGGTVSITAYAFSNCKELTNVTIPDSVTSIGSYAFYSCSSLTSITIPDSVTSIGNYALYGCSSLTGVTFSGTTGDCTWHLEGNVLTISGNGEMGAGGDRNDGSGVGVHGLGTVKFQPWCCNGNDVSQLIDEVVIEDGVTSINDFAFFEHKNLRSISIPNSVRSIGGATFSSCEKLTSINIPDSVTSIGSNAFYNCTSLTNVTIPASVEAIASNAFYDCTSLTSVTIPASVTDIYDKAFGYYYKDGFGESKVKDFTVYGYKNSEAERYANDNNFKFIALDDEPSDPTKTTDREIFGDIDGDGIITITDTTYLQRYTIKAETPYPIGEKMK